MKKLIIFLLPVLLTSCVRYYSPETAFEDGVYYAEDDPSYVLNSGDYSGFVYYPWSSLDYLYLGYWPYPGFGYAFAYTYPFGLGYSPWDYPNGYYGYHNRPYWRPYRGYCPHNGPCRKYNHDGGYDPYARKGGKQRRHAGDDDQDIRGRENDAGNDDTSSVSRYVSTTPAGYSGNQGMVIRNRESKKVGQSQVEPVKTPPSNSVSVVPSTTNTSGHSPARSSRSSFSRSGGRSSSVRSSSRNQSPSGSKSPRRRDRD
ncbi:MAG: hypothetical protein QNK19_13940 [Xanthomonadales bacterium]|nr:hypothetical protein [Xanthomonadales bacterium]